LGISAARIFTEKGGEVDDVALLRDDEVLFVSPDETAGKFDMFSCVILL
jgi:hypothetical protein